MPPDERDWCLWKWYPTLFTALLQSSQYSFLPFHSNVVLILQPSGCRKCWRPSQFLSWQPKQLQVCCRVRAIVWFSLLWESHVASTFALLCTWVDLVICLIQSYLDMLEGRANRNLIKVSKDKCQVLHPEKKIGFAITQVSDWLTDRGAALPRWPGASRVPWLHRRAAACWSAPRGTQPVDRGKGLSSSAWDLLGPI